MNYNEIVVCNLCEKNLRIVELKTKIAEADRKLEKFKNTKITDIKASAYPSDCPYKRGDNDA